jgi:putative addiction module killer protein
MIELRQTEQFAGWLAGLRDQRAKARIAERLYRFEAGNPGDTKPVGDGVMEMRIDYGPGYRVYYVQRGKVVFVLLCGGDKRSQQRDIRRAQTIAAALEE